MQKKANLSSWGYYSDEFNKGVLFICLQTILTASQKQLPCANILNSMKFIIGVLFAFLTLSVSSQTLEKITKTFPVPDGWKSRLVKDTAYFPSFGKRHVAIWEFKCDDDRTQSIWFYVFKYTRQDSMSLQQKAILYYSLSNCLLLGNTDIKENF